MNPLKTKMINDASWIKSTMVSVKFFNYIILYILCLQVLIKYRLYEKLYLTACQWILFLLEYLAL